MTTNNQSLQPIPAIAGSKLRQAWLKWVRTPANRLQALVNGWNTVDCAIDMTIVLLLLYAGNFWYLQRPIILLCSAAIFFPRLRRSDTFWLIVTAILAASHFHNWYLVDNHKYLLTYWCFALYLSFLASDQAKVLSVAAKLLIGFTFLFATLQKLLSPDFLDATFFQYSLLLDERFFTVTALFGGLSQPEFSSNYQALEDLLHYASSIEFIPMQGTVQIRQIAQLLTGWTLGIEALIALLFLMPLPKWIAKWRDIPLLVFVLTTYLIAPVIGFGWILVIMGAVQAELGPKRSRFFYLLAFFILQAYLIPWKEIVTSLV